MTVELVFGEGGDDSKLFVDDLLTAYLKYANSKNIQSEVLDEGDGHALVKFSGKGVWKAFQHESGKHVVQRVPPTERSGRRQTSIVTVAVLPLPPENTLTALKEQDIETIYQTGKQKAGGQNVNRVHSAVRMKHKPTGITVFINGRDQGQNKKEALRILTARVNDRDRRKKEKDYQDSRQSQMKGGGDKLGGRGDKVRTYNFCRNTIEDHRLDRTSSDVKSFMKGDFSAILG